MALQWIGYLKQSGWMDLLKVGGIASIISSVVTLGWNGLREARATKREVRHVALTVAIALEGYARDARLMMHRVDWARQEAAREQRYDPLKGVSLVEFTFPEPIDWKWLNHKVASQLREFPATLHSVRHALAVEWEYGDPLDWCVEVEFECAKAAKRALELSRLTRAKHGVAFWKPGVTDVDLERELTQYIAEEARKREAFREKQCRVIAGITPGETAPDDR